MKHGGNIIWSGPGIEDGFIKKLRQTVVLAFWGKMATHMLLIRCAADELLKGGQGQNCGGIFVHYIFYNR